VLFSFFLWERENIKIKKREEQVEQEQGQIFLFFLGKSIKRFN